MSEWLRLLNSPCRDIAALVSAAMDTELSRSQRWAVRIHLLYCRACRAYRRHLGLLRRILRLAAKPADPAEIPVRTTGRDQSAPVAALSPEARERIRQALRRA